MGSIRVSVSFVIEETYEYDYDGRDTSEEEAIEMAEQQLLDDFGLASWQGEYMMAMVDIDEEED